MSLYAVCDLLIIKLEKNSVILDFNNVFERDVINNLYPEYMNMLSMRFHFEVEKLIRKERLIPINSETLEKLKNLLNQSMIVVPFTLSCLLKQDKI